MGLMLVAKTDKGVCAIQFGESEDRLAQALREEFPRAVLRRDEMLLAPYTEALTAYLRGGSTRLDLPLDIRATAFQRRVWKYLQRIPYGETQSYGEVAAGIGHPAAARAVARALRFESGCGGDSMPQGGSRRWRDGRVSVGRGAEAGTAASGGGLRPLRPAAGPP